MKPSVCHASVVACALSMVASAQQAAPAPVLEAQGQKFYTWAEHAAAVEALDLRCATPERTDVQLLSAPSDCSDQKTGILPVYDPVGTLYEIPVVVHVIEHTNGNGQISDALVHSQIDILNEDFRAIAGSNGDNGTDALIQFYLATEDPQGNPTTGITRTVNSTWFNDGGSYWNTLAWDPDTYLNIYTNSASGALGYVPFLPAGGSPGATNDRVVCLWSAFGRNAPYGPPYDQGRTVTHEVGHYLGLDHTFSGGCVSGDCYSTGDLICDTERESSPVFGCPGSSNSCSTPDPYDNYLDYSDDLCMERFTPEQINRMRCTIENYRPNLPRSQCGGAATVASRTGLLNLDVFTSTNPAIGQVGDLHALRHLALHERDLPGLLGHGDDRPRWRVDAAPRPDLAARPSRPAASPGR